MNVNLSVYFGENLINCDVVVGVYTVWGKKEIEAISIESMKNVNTDMVLDIGRYNKYFIQAMMDKINDELTSPRYDYLKI